MDGLDDLFLGHNALLNAIDGYLMFTVDTFDFEGMLPDSLVDDLELVVQVVVGLLLSLGGIITGRMRAGSRGSRSWVY